MNKVAKVYIFFIVLISVFASAILYFPAMFKGPGFSFKYNRFSSVKYEPVGDNPLDEAGVVIVEGRTHVFKLTYIYKVEEADPLNIIEEFISYLETGGTVINQTQAYTEKYNGLLFHTVRLVFSDGIEEANIIYSIHYNTEKESLYYVVCSSTSTIPDEITSDYMKSFNIN